MHRNYPKTDTGFVPPMSTEKKRWEPVLNEEKLAKAIRDRDELSDIKNELKKKLENLNKSR